MTLSEAAELIGIPQKRLYRAVKAGKLRAEQRHQGSRWEYLVTRHDLEEFERSTVRLVDQDTRPTATDSTTGRPTRGPVDQDTRPTATDSTTGRPTRGPVDQPGDRPTDQPPVELYLALVDRLSRAERRSVELELQLRQSQRLLTENAESITEKEALAMEAKAQLQAVEDAKQTEIDSLRAELESTRHQLVDAQKPTGILSWLGLRRKRTSSDVGKAV